jgi:DNA-binding response OmpR family regulator
MLYIVRHFIELPPNRLDQQNETPVAWLKIIPLSPNSFALLRYLAEHPGRLITKNEMWMRFGGILS